MGRGKAEHTEQAAMALCKVWNENYPKGTCVMVVRDNGIILETKTRSEAWLTPSGGLLVSVEGIYGGYRLSRVIPKPIV